MAGGPSMTCARDGTPTQLTCTRCEAPICPRCLVRTDVGLRCEACTDTRTAPRRATRLLVIGGVLAVGVLAVGVLIVVGLLLGRGGGKGSGGGSAAAPPQHVSRADLGFSLDLPAAWTVDVDQTPGSIFFAHATPPRASARVFRGQTDQPLEQTMTNVVDELGRQGAHGFAQQPVQIGDLAGIRLDYSAADGPAGAVASHSSYRVKKGNGVFSLSLATSDPSADSGVLAAIASSFRVL